MRACHGLLLLLLAWAALPAPAWGQVPEVDAGLARMVRAAVRGSRDVPLRNEPSGKQAERPCKHTALFIAIARNDGKRARLLAPRRATLNAQDKTSGATPLCWAAQTAKPDMVAWLLDLGADLERADAQGYTPLATAARFGNAQTVTLLLERGADPNRRTSMGQRPLHLACGTTGSLEAVRRLVAAGANPHLPDRSGWTPLAMAAKQGNLALVDYLLRLGVHPDGAPGARFAPLHWASVENHVEVAARLLAAGAKRDIASPEGLTPFSWAATPAMRSLLEPSVETRPDTMTETGQ